MEWLTHDILQGIINLIIIIFTASKSTTAINNKFKDRRK